MKIELTHEELMLVLDSLDGALESICHIRSRGSEMNVAESIWRDFDVHLQDKYKQTMVLLCQLRSLTNDSSQDDINRDAPPVPQWRIDDYERSKS